MPGPQLRQRLEAFQGSDFAFGPVYFGSQLPDTTEPDQVQPIDFTGCTAEMQIAVSRSGDAPLVFQIYDGDDPNYSRIQFSSGSVGGDVPPYPDGYAIYITAADTLNIGQIEGGSYGNDGALVYQYDLFITFPDGSKQIWQTGAFQLSPSVWRSTD